MSYQFVFCHFLQWKEARRKYQAVACQLNIKSSSELQTHNDKKVQTVKWSPFKRTSSACNPLLKFKIPGLLRLCIAPFEIALKFQFELFSLENWMGGFLACFSNRRLEVLVCCKNLIRACLSGRCWFNGKLQQTRKERSQKRHKKMHQKVFVLSHLSNK